MGIFFVGYLCIGTHYRKYKITGASFQRTIIEDDTLFKDKLVYLMEFNDDSDEAYSMQILQENEMNTDVSTMTERELFNYLRGEYLLGGQLSRMMNGLAAIQVEQY